MLPLKKNHEKQNNNCCIKNIARNHLINPNKIESTKGVRIATVINKPMPTLPVIKKADIKVNNSLTVPKI